MQPFRFQKPGAAAPAAPSSRPTALALALVAVVAFWAYYPTLRQLFHKWIHDPQYSHGILVPFFALYLLRYRKALYAETRKPLPLLGGILFVSAMLGRIFSAAFSIPWIDALSILPCLAGLIVMYGGLEKLRWAWPSVLFLFFMIPLPYRIEIKLSGPLQQLATLGSTYTLQALGQPAIAEGNTILIRDVKLGIVESCSGLRMLVTFFTFSTGVSLIVQKKLWEKAIVVLSAVPIALATNVLRITCTAFLYVWWDDASAKVFFHDLAGWFMMPVCLGMLWLELQLLERLLVEEAEPQPSLLNPLRGRLLQPR